MGETNQFTFVQRNGSIVSGPILEVGSKDYGSKEDFRALFPQHAYVGADMQEGPGVDVVVDFTDDLARIRQTLPWPSFKTVLCFSTLEHCKDPFAMCRNISALLDDGGVLLVSVPFAWRLHGYPFDYWRFTPAGIAVLFPEITFDLASSNVCTNRIDEFEPIDDYMMRRELRVSRGLRRRHYGYFAAGIIVLCQKLGLLPAVFGYPYLLPPVLLNMVGRKPAGIPQPA